MTTTTKTETAEEAPAPAAPAAAGAAGLAAALSAVAALAALAVSSPHAVPPASHFCIDVECVATGPTHNDRAVAQIALVVSEAVKLFLDPPPVFSPLPLSTPFSLSSALPPLSSSISSISIHPSIHPIIHQDQYERVLLNVLVLPDRPVASYLTPLTGITRQDVERRGVPLPQALASLRAALPRTAVLVGQNIMQDVRWLGLREGADFAALADLQGLFRVWNPRYKTYSVWAQDHLAATLLGWPAAGEGITHDAAADAAKSMRLFALLGELRRIRAGKAESDAAWRLAEERLLASEPAPSFAKRHPSFEGVCMGGRKTCTCGAAFLGGF
jgi:hypothetical protein